MPAQRRKFYVVWKGRKPGIYPSWEEAKRQVEGFPNARYRAFDSLEEARRAFARDADEYTGKPSSMGKWRYAARRPVLPSVVVDAAASGPNGPMEYRGVRLDTNEALFAQGPFPRGTVNIGEFLAIVHALAWLAERGLNWPVYSDSQVARLWVERGKCKSRLRMDERLADLVKRAEKWLASHPKHAPVLAWDTREWGEIPADFGRK